VDRPAYPGHPLRLASLQQAGQRRAQVVVLYGQPFEPRRLLCPFEFRSGSQGQVAEMRGVPGAHPLLLAALLSFSSAYWRIGSSIS
jgi:hypothetical protein